MTYADVMKPQAEKVAKICKTEKTCGEIETALHFGPGHTATALAEEVVAFAISAGYIVKSGIVDDGHSKWWTYRAA